MSTGIPSGVTPIWTVSMDERMGQPTVSSVTPRQSKHRQLTLGGGAAVAAHARHDEGVRAQALQLGHDRGQDGRRCR